ncbi:hypothetical protein [Streptomyces sp. NPDC059460]|uniref:hypothetical protein n=1 Tax=Streptomyces sp. NPDC059460 TaxID=3346840 RepID=UPI0036BF39AA
MADFLVAEGVVYDISRFRCENSACTALTLAEQKVGLTTPHSRYTPLLHGMLTLVRRGRRHRTTGRLLYGLARSSSRSLGVSP